MRILKFNEGAFSDLPMHTIDDVVDYLQKHWIRDELDDMEVEGNYIVLWSRWYKLDGDDVELFVRIRVADTSVVVEFIKKLMSEHVLTTDTFKIEYDLTQVMETEVDPILKSHQEDLAYLDMKRRKIAILMRDISGLKEDMETRVGGIETREYMKKYKR